MPQMSFAVRPATPADPADGLLYTSAKPYYDAYAGSEPRARAMLASVYRRTGHAASFDVCSVVELDGDLAGVIAWFPVAEGDRRARRFVALTAPRVPPWRWPRLLRHLRAAGTVSPNPPLGTLYVDALAVAPGFRRRGVASALLDAAEEAAAGAGLSRYRARHRAAQRAGPLALRARRLPPARDPPRSEPVGRGRDRRPRLRRLRQAAVSTGPLLLWRGAEVKRRRAAPRPPGRPDPRSCAGRTAAPASGRRRPR